jgi:hypothetical protein
LQPGKHAEIICHALGKRQFTTADARIKLKRLYPSIVY